VDYTDEEVKILKGMLRWETSAFEPLCSTLTLQNIKKSICVEDLMACVKGDTAAITWFLHYVPLEDVPLYIHDFPELARWRLMIAK
jgi:hypothetical protein